MKKWTTRRRTTGPQHGEAEILKAEKLKPASGRAAARQGAVAMPNSVKWGAFDRMKKIFGLL